MDTNSVVHLLAMLNEKMYDNEEIYKTTSGFTLTIHNYWWTVSFDDQVIYNSEDYYIDEEIKLKDHLIHQVFKKMELYKSCFNYLKNYEA